MKGKLKLFALGSVAAMAMTASGQAAAVPGFGDHAHGPVWINGYVSVNNTGRPGGNVTDFACKVKGHGRIKPTRDGVGVLVIEGLQALSRASGQAPFGCHDVRLGNLPWRLTVTGIPGGAPVATTGALSLTGVNFQAVLNDTTALPGCGTASGTTGGTVDANIVWSQQSTPFAHGPGAVDPAYATVTFTNAVIRETPNLGQNCTVTGLLKITRPHAPYIVDVP